MKASKILHQSGVIPALHLTTSNHTIPFFGRLDYLKEQRVSEAQEITITKDGNKITTATIILTVHGSTVPTEINVGFLKVKEPTTLLDVLVANNLHTTRTIAHIPKSERNESFLAGSDHF